MTTSTEDVAISDFTAPVGRLSVACTTTGLVAVAWGAPDRLAYRLATRGDLPIVDDPPRLGRVLDRLRSYFAGEHQSFDLPIDWRLTVRTQQVVLRTLYETVGYGKSTTYGELAHRSGAGVPARGIGAIMGSNPIPIVVPCHRVLAHNGLGGYSGGSGRDGLSIKRWLLTLEGVLPPTFDWDPDRVTA